MNQTKEQYLSRYSIEQFWVQEDKTKLLLLVKVDKDNNIFGGKASRIDSLQNIECAKMSGNEYHHLKCTITDGNHDLLVNGIQKKQYSMPQFESNFRNLNGGIRIKFDCTNKSHHFLWNTVIEYPTTFMFLGAHLNQCLLPCS